MNDILHTPIEAAPGAPRTLRFAWIALVVATVAAVFIALYAPRTGPASAEPGASGRPRCLVAQDDLHTLELGGRVYIVDEDGSRTYLPESDRPVAIALARARVTRHCE